MILWIVDSMILAIGERRAVGLHEVCSLGSLLGLRMEMILAIFHVRGIIYDFIEELGYYKDGVVK